MAEKIMLDEGEYIGETAGGVPCGRGTMSFFDGRVFSGELDYVAQRGSGVWRYPDGSALRGGFSICPQTPFWVYTFADGRTLRGGVSRFVSEGESEVKDAEADRLCAELVVLLRARGQSIEFNARALLVDHLLRRGLDAAAGAEMLPQDEEFVIVTQIFEILELS